MSLQLGTVGGPQETEETLTELPEQTPTFSFGSGFRTITRPSSTSTSATISSSHRTTTSTSSPISTESSHSITHVKSSSPIATYTSFSTLTTTSTSSSLYTISLETPTSIGISQSSTPKNAAETITPSDLPEPGPEKFPEAAIVGILLGVTFFVAIFCVFVHWLWRRRRNARRLAEAKGGSTRSGSFLTPSRSSTIGDKSAYTIRIGSPRLIPPVPPISQTILARNAAGSRPQNLPVLRHQTSQTTIIDDSASEYSQPERSVTPPIPEVAPLRVMNRNSLLSGGIDGIQTPEPSPRFPINPYMLQPTGYTYSYENGYNFTYDPTPSSRH